jgi:hypothetical protein
MQHDIHLYDRAEHLLNQIMRGLGITWPLVRCDLTDWYACGDDLI